MKLAYIPVGAGGHILSSLPMITELVKKGVEVNYFAPNSHKAQVELTGAKHCPFPPADYTACKQWRELFVNWLHHVFR